MTGRTTAAWPRFHHERPEEVQTTPWSQTGDQDQQKLHRIPQRLVAVWWSFPVFLASIRTPLESSNYVAKKSQTLRTESLEALVRPRAGAMESCTTWFIGHLVFATSGSAAHVKFTWMYLFQSTSEDKLGQSPQSEAVASALLLRRKIQNHRCGPDLRNGPRPFSKSGSRK